MKIEMKMDLISSWKLQLERMLLKMPSTTSVSSSVLAAWNSFSSNLSCSSLFCASATHSSFRDNFLTCMHFSPHCVLPLHTCMYEFRYNQFYDKTPTFSVQRCLCVHFFGGDFPKHRPALLISLIRAFWYHQESRWSRSDVWEMMSMLWGTFWFTLYF